MCMDIVIEEDVLNLKARSLRQRFIPLLVEISPFSPPCLAPLKLGLRHTTSGRERPAIAALVPLPCGASTMRSAQPYAKPWRLVGTLEASSSSTVVVLPVIVVAAVGVI